MGALLSVDVIREMEVVQVSKYKTKETIQLMILKWK